jgi:hypothetical protein
MSRKITSSVPATACILMPRKFTLIPATRKNLSAQSWLLGSRQFKHVLLTTGLILSFLAQLARAKDHWTELNIGPYYVATDNDIGAARDGLTQLEQLRWVLGNLLEIKNLQSLWPIRVILTGANREVSYQKPQFILQSSQYLLVTSPKSRLPLGEIAGLLLDANTPRLPAEVESGFRQLFSTLEARGSRVTWGSAPEKPTLDWARMQLFATKFEYGASFHIFLASLRDGSTLAAAERNAFGKSSASLEQEAKANLAAGKWDASPVSGRPLDPKRDFGEHAIDSAIAGVYLADWHVSLDPKAAEQGYKAAVEAGESAAPLGYEGLATVAKLTGGDPKLYWEDAIRAGSNSARVYLEAANGLPATEALPLLKRAAQLNDRWAEPVYQQVQFAQSPVEKESLLKAALKLDPRNTGRWIELAQLQTTSGEASAAQGSWLRAEDSAPNLAEHDRVHALRVSSEQERLDAAEAARRRERDAANLADEQAQEAEADRIHAAERKANEALAAASGDEKAAAPVTWDSLVQEKKLTGMLLRVDCLKNGWRLLVKDTTGRQNQFFLSKETNAELTCGAQGRQLRISLAYRAMPDEDLHTAGEITHLEIR